MKSMIAALVVLAAQHPQQFDLVCAGKSAGYPTDRAEATRYRVDLTAGQWCTSTCTGVRLIERIEPSVIWFKDQQSDVRGKWIEYVDRTTGKWVRVMGPWDTEGTCEAAPFSGFPAGQTKF